jgi:FKBP-type peptidyl-prolyl cis-trans isomerase FkpA
MQEANRMRINTRPRQAKASLAIVLALAAFALAACGSESGTVEVTDAMKAQAIEQIARGEMPDTTDWEMEQTDDGVRYVVLQPGTGRDAWYDDKVRVHYYLWLTDGELVDSTRPDGVSKPFEFTVGQGRVIEGWDELIQEMNQGSTVIAVVPWQLGYGRNGRRGIPGRADLIFAVELLRISGG